MPTLSDHIAELVPTKEWVYALFQVDYLREDGSPIRSIYLSTSDPSPSDDEIARCSPGSSCATYQYTLIKDDVPHPRIVGSYYGRPLQEDAQSAGNHIAKQLKLPSL